MQSERTQNIQQWIDDTGYLVNPTATVLREIASSVTVGNGTVNLLVKPSTLRSIDREYTTASQLAKLEREGTVSFRELTGEFQTNLVVTGNVTGAFIDLDGLTVAIGSDEQDLTGDAVPIVEELWRDGDPSYLRTPPHDEVEAAFADRFDENVYETFLTAVGAMEHAGRVNTDTGNVTFADRRHTYASLLVAGAVTKSSLRELGRCAEDCGVSSRSTLSRIKQELEDDGYITTSPMQTDVGRPPMQLQRAGLYSGDDAELLAERVYEDLQRTDEE